MSESKTKETASRLSLSTSWWAGVLPCLARPLSLSCHATTIAQVDVSVCLMFKRMVLCTCVPCCLAPGLPRPSAASLALRAVWLCLLCAVCVPGLLCLPAALLSLCSAPALPHCACAVCPCPGCCVAWPVLTGLVPCCLAPLLSSPSALAPAIHLKVSPVYSWADIWLRLPGCLLLYAWL